MISNFNDEAKNLLINAKIEMQELKHPYVGTEHLILSILKSNSQLKKELESYGLTYERFKTEIVNIIGTGSKKSEIFLYTPLLKKVIENAILDSKDNNKGIVTAEHLFSSILDVGEGIAIRIMIGMNIDVEELYDKYRINLCKNSSNLLIENIGINLIDKAKNNEIDPVIERNNEIEEILEILCRRCKNNPLLIGLAGVGKTAIIEELSKLIYENKVPNCLKNKKIIALDMASAVAGTKYRGEFEERMKKIIEEIEKNQDIILFIDEIHTLVGAGGAEGAIDASNILKPALARGKIRCIGATTLEEYKKYIEKDTALDRRFQKIIINEPSIKQTKTILNYLKPIYENYHKVTINDQLINEIVDLSEKYIYNRNRPDKEIDILDEVCSKVSIKKDNNIRIKEEELDNLKKRKEKYLKEKNHQEAYKCLKKEYQLNEEIKRNKQEVSLLDIANVLSKKTSIPIYEILKEDYKTINKTEKILKENIIGQSNAIDNLINITKRIKLGYKNNKCYSMLFIGPSGVGKTKLATIYAKDLVNDNVIKLDMSEYSDSTSITKIIGSNPGYIGYDDNKYLLNIIKDKPNSIIILDEIDKAHQKVINLLYQILDEGKIKDSKGNTIMFNNTIIIMTSNEGIENMEIGFNQNNEKDNTNLKDIFPISFINRIDNIILFNKLNKENIEEIINKKLALLKEKYQNININFKESIIDEIIKLSEYKTFGARKIDKIIENKIETLIIDKIINKEKNITIDSILIHE